MKSSFEVLRDDERTQLEAFLEEYRGTIEATLTGLSEEQVRRRLVPSATTPLGLVKHVTWMQRVWFEQCVGGTPRENLGLASGAEESFRVAEADSVGLPAGPTRAGPARRARRHPAGAAAGRVTISVGPCRSTSRR